MNRGYVKRFFFLCSCLGKIENIQIDAEYFSYMYLDVIIQLKAYKIQNYNNNNNSNRLTLR